MIIQVSTPITVQGRTLEGVKLVKIKNVFYDWVNDTRTIDVDYIKEGIEPPYTESFTISTNGEDYSKEDAKNYIKSLPQHEGYEIITP